MHATTGLDKIEKKFGGDRFDETKHPENAAKNKALNENSEFPFSYLCFRAEVRTADGAEVIIQIWHTDMVCVRSYQEAHAGHEDRHAERPTGKLHAVFTLPPIRAFHARHHPNESGWCGATPLRHASPPFGRLPWARQDMLDDSLPYSLAAT